MSQQKKIILFGGSFDPIHTGHVHVAQHARRQLNADELIFVPARRSPHKTETPAAGCHRLAMIQAAIEGLDGFSVSDCELLRAEPSYTLDTIRFFRDRFGPDAVLHWLIGADQLDDLGNWYRIDDLLAACRITVMHRAGYPLPDFGRLAKSISPKAIEQLKSDVVKTPLIDLSSTDVRRQLAAGTLEPYALAPAVLGYIKQHRLYNVAS